MEELLEGEQYQKTSPELNRCLLNTGLKADRKNDEVGQVSVSLCVQGRGPLGEQEGTWTAGVSRGGEGSDESI